MVVHHLVKVGGTAANLRDIGHLVTIFAISLLKLLGSYSLYLSTGQLGEFASLSHNLSLNCGHDGSLVHSPRLVAGNNYASILSERKPWSP